MFDARLSPAVPPRWCVRVCVFLYDYSLSMRRRYFHSFQSPSGNENGNSKADDHAAGDGLGEENLIMERKSSQFVSARQSPSYS